MATTLKRAEAKAGGPRRSWATAWATLGYAVGLYAYAGVKVVAPAFYALDRARVPLYASVSAVAANIVFNVLLFPVLSFKGLALGTSLAATLNFGILVFAFRRGFGLPLRGSVGHLARVFLAAIPCALAAIAVAGALESWLGVEAVSARIVTVGLAIAAGGLAYALACKLLRVAELEEIRAFVARRLRR